MSEDPRDGDRDRPRASGPPPGRVPRGRGGAGPRRSRLGCHAAGGGCSGSWPRPPARPTVFAGREKGRQGHARTGDVCEGELTGFPSGKLSFPRRGAASHGWPRPHPCQVSSGRFLRGEVPRVPAPRRALLALLPSRLWRFQPFWVAAVERQMEVIKLSGVPGLGTRVSSAGLYRTSGGKRRALGGCWTLPKTPLGPKVKQKGEEHLFILFLRLSLLGGRPPSESMVPWGGGSNEDLGYLGAGGLCQGVCADAPGMVAGLQQASQEWSLPSVLG